MSPEAYQSNLYSEKSDIWALGVIFYEMLTGRTCDHGMDMKEYLNVVEKKGITFHKPVSQFHRFLVSNMLQFDHHARFDCLQLTRTLK
jgi:serine/threonine protein kinase